MKPSIEQVAKELLADMFAQAPIAPEKVDGKLKELRVLINEVGEPRAREAVTRALREHPSEFCPSISVIRSFVSEHRRRGGYCGRCLDGFLKTENGAMPCKCTGGSDRLRRIQGSDLGPIPSQQERASSGDFPAPEPVFDSVKQASDRDLQWGRDAKPNEFFGESDVVLLIRLGLERQARSLPPAKLDDLLHEIATLRAGATKAPRRTRSQPTRVQLIEQ